MIEQSKCPPDSGNRAESIASRAGHARGAFTLVEMLVAVGAVALVSVGLAAVFQTVGQTVTTGKRVSALTQQAAILESQMREDFKNMSREGFLVIRHQYTLGRGTGNGQVVIPASRFAGDPVVARPRRIDELLFFANGEFRTAKEDLIPGRTAKSRAARIYYGHGQKAAVQTPESQQNATADMRYLNPTFADWFRDSDGISSRLGEANNGGVNRYASTWNLIRQATLLSRPTSVTDGGWPEDRPRPQGWDVYANTQIALTNLSSDSTFQIAGQPAANSIFRTINEMLPMVSQYSGSQSRRFAMFWELGTLGGSGTTPRACSGVVDIAATDLDEIAMIVNGSRYSPGDFGNDGTKYFSKRLSGVGVLEAPMPLMNGPWIGSEIPAFFSSSYVVPVTPNTLSALNTTAGRMQAWMLNAMPSPSGYHPTIYLQDQNQMFGGDGVKDRIGYRVRCEDDLPDIRGTMDAFSGRAVQTKRNSLMSVGLSKIAARCSEFVVEWSWGQSYPMVGVFNDEFGRDVRGQTIWYGRSLIGFTSPTPTNFVGSNTAGAANPDIFRYDPSATYAGISGKYSPSGRLMQAPTAAPAFKPYKGSPEFAGIVKIDDYVVPDWLTHGVTKWRLNGLEQSSLVSYFGYFDPTYTQDDVTQPPSLPWAWPKLIRVTFTLADAADPSIEQTFQYVFDLPPDPKP